jgi:hypothetical protein
MITTTNIPSLCVAHTPVYVALTLLCMRRVLLKLQGARSVRAPHRLQQPIVDQPLMSQSLGCGPGCFASLALAAMHHLSWATFNRSSERSLSILGQFARQNRILVGGGLD